MKALTLLVAAGLGGIVIAQTGFTYRSPKLDPRLIITGRSGWVELDKSFEVTGGVKLESKTDKFVLTGDRVSGDLAKENKKTVADHIRARGAVKLAQEQKNGNLTVKAAEADYDLVDATLAKLAMRGNVSLDFLATTEKSGNSDVTAKSLEAIFKRKPGKDEDSLVAFNVTGPVSYTGVSVSEKGKSTITARADRMSYEAQGEGAEMKLSGNIYFDQKGPEDEDSADVTGAQSVILTLNKAKEVVGIRMSSEGIGKIVTKIKKKGGNRV
jgi:lipopolysaccharide export system protein LptA